jgi:hypothetical protein
MNDKDIFETKDKQLVPFLLTQQEVNFIGTKLVGSTLYFQFSPLEKCQKLINDFATRKAPLVQPKDILEAVETFRDMVFEMKDKRRNNGGYY